MKKIMVVAVGVLFCTLAFANGTEGATASSVAVMNSGSNLFKVFYKAPKPNDVTISIRNEKEKVVFSEVVKKTDGFMRPYNFEDLAEGTYTIEIQDENGTQVQTISYNLNVEKIVDILKAPSAEGKYIMTGFSKGADKIIIRIYDVDGNTTYEEVRDVNGEFIQFYNLKNLKGRFSIEVSDKNGILKTFRS